MATSIIKQQNMKLDLLWTNPNPNNNLTGQTINVDCSKYELFLIEAFWTKTGSSTVYSIAKKNIKINLNIAYNRNYYRKVKVSDSNIVLSDCSALNSYNSATEVTANDNLIIYKVYGIL